MGKGCDGWQISDTASRDVGAMRCYEEKTYVTSSCRLNLILPKAGLSAGYMI